VQPQGSWRAQRRRLWDDHLGLGRLLGNHLDHRNGRRCHDLPARCGSRLEKLAGLVQEHAALVGDLEVQRREVAAELDAVTEVEIVIGLQLENEGAGLEREAQAPGDSDLWVDDSAPMAPRWSSIQGMKE
jgi:hypothetical protein